MAVVDGPGPFGLGCVNLGHPATGGPDRSVRLVQMALDLGVRCFDTADSYGSGTSERVLGRALRHRRDRAFVATKVGYVFKERTASGRMMRAAAGAVLRRSRRAATNTVVAPVARASYRIQDFSPSYIRAALEGSLRRLGTDYIDLYQLHGPREVRSEAIGLMADLRSEGKIRGFGVGLETLGAASDWLASGVSSIQAPFGILDPEAGEKVIPEAFARGIPVIVRGVFAGGLMANGSNHDEALLRSGQPELRSQIRALAATAGVDPMQLAAWFVTRQPGVTTVLVGTTSELHLEESLRYVLCSPPPDLLTILDELGTVARTHDAATRQAGGS